MTDFLTIVALNSWLGIPGGGTDAVSAALISAASQYVRSYCNRDFTLTSYSEVYDSHGGRRLFVGNYPIIAVTSIAWAGMTPLTSANQIDPTQYGDGFYFTDHEIILTQRCFPRKMPVSVSYSAGYATIPVDLVQAATELAGEAFKRRNRVGEASQTLNGQEATTFITAAMNSSIKLLLDQYKNVVPA